MTANAQLDEHISSTMSADELALLNDSEMSEEERAALAKVAGGGDDDDDDEDDDDSAAGSSNKEPVEGKGAPDPTSTDADPAKVAAQSQAAATAAAATTTAATSAPDPKASAQANTDAGGVDTGKTQTDAGVFYRVELPKDFNDQVKTLTDERTALRAKLREGEIDIDQYESEIDKVNDKIKALDNIRLKAELSAEMEEAFYKKQWENTISSLYRQAAKNDGIDYTKDAVKQKDLDMFVRVLGADPANEDKSMDWFLSEAHRRVMALHGIAAKTPTQPNTPNKTNRSMPVDAAPKTLAQVPGSDGPGDDGGSEFADIDALNGEELEAAIADMARRNPKAYAKYMAGK
ncbi:MAG TPA: hypothetical protein VFV57_05945 [Limnobacter sp.]|nr:hypothetical protein [Limnobacter sp.]